MTANKNTKYKIIFFLSIILLTISGSLFFYNEYIKERLSEQHCTILEEIMQQQKFNFDSKLTNDMEVIKNLSKTISAFSNNKEKISDFLNEHVKDTHFSYLYYAELNGDITIEKDVIINISDREYFKQATAGQTVISDPVYARFPAVNKNEKSIVIATPIYKENIVSALLVGSYEGKFLDELFLSAFGGVGYSYVTTNSGEIIANSKNSYSLMDGDQLFEEWASADFYMSDNLETIYKNLHNNKGGHSRYLLNGNRRYLHYSTIKVNDWNIFSIAPEEAITKTSNQVIYASMILTFFTGVLFSLFILYNYYSQEKHVTAITKIAYTNEVTNSPTFAKFKIEAMAKIKKNKNKNYILLKFDVEDFKLINELHDFQTGDKVLKIIANSIEVIIDKKYDAFAHINSDEFIVLSSFEETEEYNNKIVLLEKIIDEQIKKIIDFKAVLPGGRYVVSERDTNIMEIFEKVNFAHRVAKKNKLLFCDYNEEIKKLAIQDKDIENKMELAFERQEFKMFLQPKYRLSDESIVGAEALVRWEQKTGEMIYPCDFIPIFERNGFITKLDMYMFEKACKTIRKILDDNNPPIPISVNFSRHHLGKKHFVTQLCQIADKYNVPHEYLEIELTETVMYNNLHVMEKIMGELHEANFIISMDDFGTGYSSLGLLKDIPIDIIKIDKSFFDTVKDNKRAIAVVGSVMDMAKRLVIKTVAEGVETIENIELLRELGCDMVQGYYYAKPMTVEEFEKLNRTGYKP